MSKSSTTTKKEKLPPIHPGEILLEDLQDEEVSINGLARAIGVPPNRISQIVNGKRDITADTAVRLAKFFGTSPEYWLDMQSHYELRLIDQEAIGRVVVPFRALLSSPSPIMIKQISAEEAFSKPLTRKQKAEIRAIERMRDEDIDTSDIPEIHPAPGDIIRAKDMVHPGPVDVKAIRTGLKLSQAGFAARFGFSVRTVQDWESSGAQPPSHVRAYLTVIDRIPKAVIKALSPQRDVA